MYAKEKECRSAGFDDEQIKKIESIARRISKCGKEAAALGIEIFGGCNGGGTLRFNDSMDSQISRKLVLADLDGDFDGGDGGADRLDDDDGLLRGEQL